MLSALEKKVPTSATLTWSTHDGYIYTGIGATYGKALHYEGSKFHRVIPDFMIQVMTSLLSVYYALTSSLTTGR